MVQQDYRTQKTYIKNRTSSDVFTLISNISLNEDISTMFIQFTHDIIIHDTFITMY